MKRTSDTSTKYVNADISIDETSEEDDAQSENDTSD